MDIKNAKIGVIGYGNFGKVVCNNLFTKNQIFLLSKNHRNDTFSKNISLVSSMEELMEKSDLIIPCVPIRFFEETIKEIAKQTKPTTIVMDICSVKEYPVSIMERYLPKDVSVIASHPMFGPNSIKTKGGLLDGLTMVMWNISTDKGVYSELVEYFKNLRISIVEMTPKQHDELSANSQFFALCIGELAQALHLKSTEIDTPGARAIFDAMQYMGADRHIIEDMAKYNVYCKKLLGDMITVLSSLKGDEKHE